MMNKFGKYLKEYLDYNNISIKEFAYRIGTTPKNLGEIISGEIKLSSNMIYNISFITDIPVSFIENMEKNYLLDKNIEIFLKKSNVSAKEYLKKFSYKELSEKYGVEYKDERNEYDILKDIMKFLRISNLEQIYEEEKGVLYKSKNDKPELLALWLEKCYKEACKQNIKEYKKENINNLIKFILEQANNNKFDEELLKAKFNDNGIYLVILNDLKNSKIRGAFKVLNDKPAIYLTKKHQRIADIYFALLHEMAHLKSDYNRAKSGGIISLVNEDSDTEYEKKADETAFNWMVDNLEYEKIKKDLTLLNSSKYPKSFIAYRLADDKLISYSSKLYQDNNILINDKK